MENKEIEESFKDLGVPYGAPKEVVKNAYHNIMKQNHPDSNPNNKEAEEKAIQASIAYKKLKEYYDTEKNQELQKQKEDEQWNNYSDEKDSSRIFTEYFKNYMNNFVQEEKLNTQKQKVAQKIREEEQKKEILARELRLINISEKRTLNAHISDIISALNQTIREIEQDFSLKIQENNNKMISKIFEKRRIEENQKVLEKEKILLKDIKWLLSKIEEYKQKEKYFEINELSLEQSLIDFLSSLGYKSVYECNRLIIKYQEKYEELKNKLEEGNNRTIEINQELSELEKTLSSLNTSFDQINRELELIRFSQQGFWNQSFFTHQNSQKKM